METKNTATTNAQWPETLVELPDSWVSGGSTICTEDEEERHASEYGCGDDDEGRIDLKLLRVNDDGSADYLGGWHHDGYHRNMRQWVHSLRPEGGIPGWFYCTYTWDSEESWKADEEG